METRLRRAIIQALRAWLQALRARTKSSPMASKMFGLWPNWNRLTTGASRIDKELTYGEQNVRPLGGAKSEKHCKSVFVHFVVLFIFHHFIAIFLKQIKKLKFATTKNDTYSPYMDFVISLIFYFTTASFWAITFGNPSINDEMALISIAGIGKDKQEHCG